MECDSTHQQVCSALKQIVWIEDSLVMSSQVRADCLPRGEAHLDRDLGPAPVLAHKVESPLVRYQLEPQSRVTFKL